MKRIIKLTESDLIKIVKRVISEQQVSGQTSTQTSGQTQPVANYEISGSKFCYDGKCTITINVNDKKTNKNKIFKTLSDKEKNIDTLYNNVSKMVNDDLKKLNITGLTVPTKDQLIDRSPKK